jgi:hypothetical protein
VESIREKHTGGSIRVKKKLIYMLFILMCLSSCMLNRSVKADVYMFDGNKMLYILEHNKYYYARLGSYYNPDYISFGAYTIDDQQKITLKPQYSKNVETISLEFIPSNDTSKMEIIVRDENNYSMQTNCGTLIVNDSIRIIYASDSISFVDEDILDFRYESPNGVFVSDKIIIPDKFTGKVFLKLEFDKEYLDCNEYADYIWEDVESSNYDGSDFRNFQTIELDTSYSVSVSQRKYSLLHRFTDDHVLKWLLKK